MLQDDGGKAGSVMLTPKTESSNDRTLSTLKVLLVSAVPPSTQYTGALMLHSLCQTLKPEQLSCFGIITPSLNTDIHEQWSSIPYRYRFKPTESQVRRLPGRLGALESFLKEELINAVAIPKLGREIIEFAHYTGASLIWCTLEGQTLIRVAEYLQNNTPLPIVTQVWDPPGWWLRDNNVDGWSHKKVITQFGRVLTKSKAVAVASWSMEEEYKKAFKCNAISVIPGMPENLAKNCNSVRESQNIFRIGFAGQFYSRKEWEFLLGTLESMNWTIGEKKIEIKVLGKTCSGQAFGPANIHYLGWRDQEESLAILADCDILYCPYWFDSIHETEARLSFPSKLTTYLASGKAVLFHGPAYSSPSRFLAKWDAAAQCNVLEKQTLSSLLIELAEKPEMRKKFQKNGNKAFRAELTNEKMHSQFVKALKNGMKSGFGTE